MPDELPAVTLPPSLNAARSFAERLGRDARSGMLVLGERLVAAPHRNRDDLVGQHAGGDGRLGQVLAARGEAILRGAIDVVALGDVLGRHAHQVVAPGIGQQRERPVHELVRPEPPAVAGLVVEERLPAHALVPARDDDAGVAELHLLRRRHDRLQPGRAEPVHVHRRRRRRQAGGEHAAPRVVRVRPDLPHLAHHDLVDVTRLDARRGEDLADTRRGELVGLDILEAAAEAADRRARASNDHSGRRHRGHSSPAPQPDAALTGAAPRARPRAAAARRTRAPPGSRARPGSPPSRDPGP